MARQGYWLCEYVSISRILKRARGAYARAYLYSESDENDVTYFLLYQLRVLLRAIDELHAYLARKAAEMRAAADMVRRATRIRGDFNHRQLAVIQHAAANPEARYTIASHRRSHGVTYQTARTDLLKLAQEHLLEQVKVGRAFVFIPSRDLHERLEARSRR
jgi:Fic family protein